MNRRDFLAGTVSSVLASVGLGTDENVYEKNNNEAVISEECDQCRKLQQFKNDVRRKQIPNTEYERQHLKRIVDPKNHSWENDCLYTQTTPIVNERVHEDHTFDKDDVREMDYDIHISSPTPHHIDVNINFHPPAPLREIKSSVTIGGVSE